MLRIRIWPDKILKKKCRKVCDVDDKVRAFLGEMQQLMIEQKGIGLAGNQAGLGLALVVVEVRDKACKLVNPRILKKEGSITFKEGCLSFPGVEIDVKRANKIWIDAQDENGKPLQMQVEGVMAVVFQHEIDHINGISFIDRIPLWKKLHILPKLAAIKKRRR
ncbi:MAG: peptide deformylase [Candidatus Omnitrophica bacterium]|nr:peptide deformylase [Candidatus Omnitrophota bacterium]